MCIVDDATNLWKKAEFSFIIKLVRQTDRMFGGLLPPYIPMVLATVNAQQDRDTYRFFLFC